MTDDLARRLRNLRQSLADGDIDDAAFQRGLSRLRDQYGAAQVDALPQQPSAGELSSGVSVYLSTESGTLSNSPVSIVQHTDNVTFPLPPDPSIAKAEQATLAYLHRLVGDCASLTLGAIDPTDASHRPIELARVYVGLNTTEQARMTSEEMTAPATRRIRGDRMETTRPVSALEALCRPNGHRLMLLGAPGSGKSTFVSHLALCLAGSILANAYPNYPAPEGGWSARLPAWTRGDLLPVRVVLRDLAAFAPLANAPRGTVKLFEDFLAGVLDDMGSKDAFEPLRTALRDGSALLLLDGFDEVVGMSVLERVSECISEVSRGYRCPIAVTCRILDYQEENTRHLPGFAVSTLADLDDKQVDQFVHDWYAGLAASGRCTVAEAVARTSALQGAISERSELRELANLPLLLTVMALVHAFKGKLPDSRAQLYAECVDLLLLRWRQPGDGSDLVQSLELADFKEDNLLELMAQLGFLAHRKAERNRETRGPADLTEDEVTGLFGRFFSQYDERRKLHLAEQVFHALARGNGLLLKRGPATYAFPHRTFQEYLAGQHIKRNKEYRRMCRALAPLPHWHEALTLMVGSQVLDGGDIERPLLMAESLLDGSSQTLALAGELLAIIGRERAARYSADDQKRIWQKAIQTLRTLSAKGQPPEAPAELRARCGRALGTLCYGTLEAFSRATAPVFVPDVRLPFALIGTPYERDPKLPKLLQHYWCQIEPGPFWSGDDREEELAQADITTPYAIGRYPVTNADFARFVAANGPDGYELDKPWWTEQGRAYILPGGYRFEDEPQQIRYPRFWDRGRYNNPLQPVVGISWYEAAAYCRWLTAEGRRMGWLSQNMAIRLPTWHEWERAARHTDTRKHPWGDTPVTAERANYQVTNLGAGAPIGTFPSGAAVCGTQHMAGDVLEWTASPWEKWNVYKEDFTDTSLVTESYSYYGSPESELMYGARGGVDPGFRNDNRGFRVVRSLTLAK